MQGSVEWKHNNRAFAVHLSERGDFHNAMGPQEETTLPLWSRWWQMLSGEMSRQYCLRQRLDSPVSLRATWDWCIIWRSSLLFHDFFSALETRIPLVQERTLTHSLVRSPLIKFLIVVVMDGWYFLRKHAPLWASWKVYLLLSGGATVLETQHKGWHLKGCEVDDILSLLIWCRLHKGPSVFLLLYRVLGGFILFCSPVFVFLTQMMVPFSFFFHSHKNFTHLRKQCDKHKCFHYMWLAWKDKAKDHCTVAVLSITHHCICRGQKLLLSVGGSLQQCFKKPIKNSVI